MEPCSRGILLTPFLAEKEYCQKLQKENMLWHYSKFSLMYCKWKCIHILASAWFVEIFLVGSSELSCVIKIVLLSLFKIKYSYSNRPRYYSKHMFYFRRKHPHGNTKLTMPHELMWQDEGIYHTCSTYQISHWDNYVTNLFEFQTFKNRWRHSPRLILQRGLLKEGMVTRCSV